MSNANGVGSPVYIKGVPHPLPPGETLLWEGAPATRAVAAHVFHWRFLAGYFVLMLAWWCITTRAPFASSEFAMGLFVVFALSVLVLGIAWGLSSLVASTSWYAITSQRVVLRLGMVFPMSINVPFSVIENAAVGNFKDGTGQVLLSLGAEHRIAYIALWPHCRVFKFAQPEPLLRGLPDAAKVGGILAQAVADASAHDASTRVQRAPAREAGADNRHMPQPAGA
jgi:hypothetical protein